MPRPPEAAHHSRATCLLALLNVCLLIAPAAAFGQSGTPPPISLSGRVLDDRGGPVPGAEVLIAGIEGRLFASQDGRFHLVGLLPGAYTVTARRLGFAPATATAMLYPGEQKLELVLRELPYRLAAVRVEALEVPRHLDARFDHLNTNGFYRRRSRGLGGTFVTRADIDRMQARRVTDLLRLAPGFRTVTGNQGLQTRVSNRESSAACRMRFYLDGVGLDMRGNYLDQMVHVQDIEAVELYSGISTAPAEFSGEGSRGSTGCGVIVVWTRRT